MLTHGNLASNIRQVLDHPGLALNPRRRRASASLPLFHVFGLNAVLGIGLAAGGCTVLLDQFDAAAAVRAVREHQISVLAGVPAMYHAFLELDDATAPPTRSNPCAWRCRAPPRSTASCSTGCASDSASSCTRVMA